MKKGIIGLGEEKVVGKITVPNGSSIMRVEALFKNVDSNDWPDLYLKSPSGKVISPEDVFTNPEVVEITDPEVGVWEIWIVNSNEISTNYTVTSNYLIN